MARITPKSIHKLRSLIVLDLDYLVMAFTGLVVIVAALGLALFLVLWGRV